MKKILMLLLLLPTFLFSEDYVDYKTENYLFSSPLKKESLKDIMEFCEQLNSELNRVLKLKNSDTLREIIIQENLESYHDYLELLDIPKRDDFIFLKFSNNISKVVIYKSETLQPSTLAHHLTLQYLNTYGEGAPQWFNIGIATYFEDFRLSQNFNRSNKWLYTLKRSSTINTIFSTLKNSKDDKVKQYSSWILIDYLINGDIKEHNRLLWDSLSLLKYSKNSNKKNEFTNMYIGHNLDAALLKYIDTIKGYNDYMNLAIEKYQSQNYKESIELFKKAIAIEPNNYSPEYYIGLCYSNIEEYNRAYSHFSNALGKDAPKDIVYYSIGINFYSAKEFIQAENYLSKLEDKMYQNMAKKVLDEISKY